MHAPVFLSYHTKLNRRQLGNTLSVRLNHLKKIRQDWLSQIVFLRAVFHWATTKKIGYHMLAFITDPPESIHLRCPSPVPASSTQKNCLPLQLLLPNTRLFFMTKLRLRHAQLRNAVECIWNLETAFPHPSSPSWVPLRYSSQASLCPYCTAQFHMEKRRWEWLGTLIE